MCNVWHLLNKISAQIKNEHILNGFTFRKVHIITRYNNQLIEGYVDSPSKFELFIQLVLINVFKVGWLYTCPFILFILALITFNISTDCFEISVHNIPTCVLIHFVLRDGMNT